MALRIELTGDRDRGPGYGQLRLSPFTAQGSVGLLVESNQGKQPFLAANGQWSAQEVWHEVPVTATEDQSVIINLGPELVDPIATQPSRVVFQARIRANGVEEVSRLMVRTLLPSAAGGERPDSGPGTVIHGPATEPPKPVIETPPAIETAPVEDQKITVDDRIQTSEPLPGRKPPLVAILGGLAVLIIAVVAGAWYAGLIPFGHQGDTAAEPSAPVAATAPQPAPTAPAPTAITSLTELNAFLQTNPDAATAKSTGDTLMRAGKPDLAMLAFQYGARQGNADAALAVARMYDPDTWSKDTSALPQADAETAAYWYEPAAQAGNVEAQRQLGKIMIQANPSGFQHDKGMEWLNKAAAAGDDKAKTLVQGK